MADSFLQTRPRMQPRSFTSQRTSGSPALALGERRAAAGVFPGTSPESQGGGREEMEVLCLPGTVDRVLLLTRLHQRLKAQDVQTCQMCWCLPVTDSAGHRTPQRDARSKRPRRRSPLTANQGARMRHFVYKRGAAGISLPRFPLPAALRGIPDSWKLSYRVDLSITASDSCQTTRSCPDALLHYQRLVVRLQTVRLQVPRTSPS